jgi:Glycine transporter
MTTASPLLLALDLTGTFAFGLNGALTAVKATRLDIVGVLTLGVSPRWVGGSSRTGAHRRLDGRGCPWGGGGSWCTRREQAAPGASPRGGSTSRASDGERR